MLVEGVHFDLALSSPADVGYKAVAANVSDVAAMGAEPRYALIALGAPPETAVSTVEGLIDGIAEAAGEFGVSCVGGDTVAGVCLVLSVTLAGDAPATGAILRSGARAGDLLCMTGDAGAAAAGLALLRRGDAKARAVLDRFPNLARAHRRGRARVAEGREAAALGARAMIDVSDGVAVDAGRVAAESGVGLVLLAETVSRAPGVSEAAAVLDADPVRLALGGGEDYELLIAVHPHDVDFLRDALAPTPLGVIGEFKGDERVVVWPDDTRDLLHDVGWEHFA
jgi:thiamine-monophosphate kinase